MGGNELKCSRCAHVGAMGSSRLMQSQDIASPVVSYARWLAKTGISPVTGYRWRQRGWITAINIAGRLYLSRPEMERFQARAAAGEFSRPLGSGLKKEAKRK